MSHPTPGAAPVIGTVAPAAAPAIGTVAPAINTVPPAVAPAFAPAAAPAIGTVAPAIGTIGSAVAAPAIGTIGSAVAAPAIGTIAPPAIAPAVAPAAAAPAGSPAIGTVALSPSQRVHERPEAPMQVQPPYEPPTAAIPDAPNPPGKWIPEYTKDKKSYVVPGLDGVAETDTFIRATTHAKTLDDTGALTDWRLRATVLGLARNPELLDGLRLDGADHISQLGFSDRLALTGVSNKAARRAGADDGSDFGTKLHGYLQAMIEGVVTMDQVPALFQPYLTVLFNAARQQGLSFVSRMTERTVFIPATGMVGTLDFLAVTEDGTLVVGDLKTSSSIDFGWLAIGVQLAQYANATMMLSWDGTHWEQMPPVSKVIAKVIVVPMNASIPTCRIYTVNLDLGMQMVDLASRVRAIHESSRRAASHPELYGAADELMAWADGDPVLLTRNTTVPAAVA